MLTGMIFMSSLPSFEWNHPSLERWVPCSFRVNATAVLWRKSKPALCSQFYFSWIFSLSFFFPLIPLHGRAAARTITTATESGANWLETTAEKEHPLTSPPLCMCFLGQECARISSGITQLWAQQFSWHLGRRFLLPCGSCSHSGFKPVFIQAEAPGLSLPVSAAPTPSLRHKKEGCYLRSLHEPPDEHRVPPRQQGFGLDRASAVTLS